LNRWRRDKVLAVEGVVMELQLQAHAWGRRAPDWRAAAAAGFAAGAVLMVLELVWAASMHMAGPWRIPHLVAALVMGPGILDRTPHEFNLAVVSAALITHYVLGIVFGLALGALIAGFHYETSLGMIQTIGAGFGLVLYLINFHLLTYVLPWFTELRGWGTLMAHLAFGVIAALLYWKLARPAAGGE
jgi:hypothetical protein